jgi:VCBS repeat protein/carboxypeptidase family protein
MRKTKINYRLFLALGLALACLMSWPARNFEASAQAGCSAPSFAPDLPVITNAQFPQAVTVADFNQDGHTDIAVANNSAFTVTMLLGDGTGNFTIKGHFDAGEQPYSIASGDFNLDGKPDVAVANQASPSNRVNILLGDGTGGIYQRREFIVKRDDGYTYNGSNDLAVGDFNLDGKPDLAVTFRVDAGIGILLGDGAGDFDTTGPPVIPTHSGPTSIVVSEFDANGIPDLAVAHESGYVKIFSGTGDGNFTSNPCLSYNLNTPLNDIATGYFNEDGEIDLVVIDGMDDSQSDTGHATVLFGLVGPDFTISSSFAAHTDSNNVAVADFNGDGESDLALTNFGSNDVSVLLGTGTGAFGLPTNFTVGTNPWGIATGDFTDDGRPDLVAANRGFNGSSYNVSILRNTCDVSIIEGRVADGSGVPISGVTVNLTGTQTRATTTDAAGHYTFAGLPGGGNYTVAPAMPARKFSPPFRSYANLNGYRTANFVLLGNTASDFDADGKTDTAVWNPNSGYWRLINSSDGAYRQQQWGAASLGDVLVPGDYDGDYKTDFGVWRPSEGNWYIVRSSDNSVLIKGWGAASLGDRPVPGDYDGDRKTDIAVFRPGEGNWYILQSTGGVKLQGWGAASDVLVPADYDGDGKTDIAVWRGSEGNWYILQSSNGAAVIKYWGGASYGDRPIPADYDGDGKTDIAVYRPGEATWYIVHSSDNSIRIKHWGFDTDERVPGDYDGDGKADITVWRPTEGNWYVLKSSEDVVLLLNLGFPDEVPVMSAYMPE